MSKTENTLVNGMFVKEHTFESGTKIVNIGIKARDFFQFMKDNVVEDKQGGKWLNIKLIPNKVIKENKISHTPILNPFTPKPADVAAKNLALDILHKPSVEEREIVETSVLPF